MIELFSCFDAIHSFQFHILSLSLSLAVLMPSYVSLLDLVQGAGIAGPGDLTVAPWLRKTGQSKDVESLKTRRQQCTGSPKTS